MFLRFVDTFRPDNHPELMAVSGGEAFLRPDLVRELAERARLAGCRTMALSGMFWARARRIPPPIKRAIDALDHFSVSLDVFHEREVRREDVYRVLETLLEEGKDVSMHLVGLDADDAYLAERTEEVNRIFEGRVPMLVNDVYPVGRAREWMDERVERPFKDADPCTLAAWPLVAFDGTIVGCANDDVVDGPAPPHLRLGHASSDGWPEVRARCLTSAMLRAIRTYGPQYVADRHGEGAVTCTGYCSTCKQLSTDPELERRVADAMATPSAALVEEQAKVFQLEAGPLAFIRRHGIPEYAELVTLGAPT